MVTPEEDIALNASILLKSVCSKPGIPKLLEICSITLFSFSVVVSVSSSMSSDTSSSCTTISPL